VVLAWIAVLVLALLFGSFLNVCIARLPRHRSIVRPGSHCPRCLAPVRPRDNIPVVSWLLLRGRCRHCRQTISLRYPLVELGYAALVAACLARFGWTEDAAGAAVFCFLMLGLLVTDIETMLLPDSLTLPGLALGLLWACTARGVYPGSMPAHLWITLEASALGGALLAVAAWTLLLLAIRWSYYAVRGRHGLGLGDVKLVAMLAAWLGLTLTGVCFFLAVVGAALFGLGWGMSRALRRGSSPGQPRQVPWHALRLPFGAFLCGGGLYAFFFGREMLRWYLSFWL
jgi:leader peptidase (prepilin peptidase)/N-methyltransferase